MWPLWAPGAASQSLQCCHLVLMVPSSARGGRGRGSNADRLTENLSVSKIFFFFSEEDSFYFATRSNVKIMRAKGNLFSSQPAGGEQRANTRPPIHLLNSLTNQPANQTPRELLESLPSALLPRRRRGQTTERDEIINCISHKIK